MQKSIVFQSVVRISQDYVTDDIEYGFRFYVIDSELVGEPEEISSASHHKIKVGIAYELRFNWRLDEGNEKDLIKVLFHYGRKYVENKVKDNTLQKYEELYLSMEDHPERSCPLDLSRIPDPVDSVFQVNVDNQAEKFEDFAQVLGRPNIAILMERMNDTLRRNDYAGVLHASASIFETMAKDIVDIPSVQDQTLKSFFDRYRRDSTLPKEILDYILAVYDTRSKTPLAGHGSIEEPKVSKKEAITLAEMTKAFVSIEYRLRRAQLPNNNAI